MKIISLKWEKDRMSLLYPLIQRGVRIRVRPGCSVRSLLCEQFGLDPEYVARRIQTAFLDGKPVDDFASAKIGEGSVLALSGALPGLAGATLRRGGVFSPMRATLSHRGQGDGEEKSEGFITVRIFNILLEELTPAFLAHGIYLERGEFDTFFRGLSPKDRENLEKKMVEASGELGWSEREAGKRIQPDLIEVRTER